MAHTVGTGLERVPCSGAEEARKGEVLADSPRVRTMPCSKIPGQLNAFIEE